MRRPVLYLLSGIGVSVLALVGLLFIAHSREERAPARVAIDEAAAIEKVMGDTYGKYSEKKKGWLYVGEYNATYLMRVVHRTKIAGGADGDELYFVASGAATDGRSNAMYGVFHVRPNPNRDGGITYENKQVMYSSKLTVRPEQVHFQALSKNLLGWVVETQHGEDPTSWPVQRTTTVLAPHDGGIAVLGEFLTASDSTPNGTCEEAKAAWDAFKAPPVPGTAAAEDDDPGDGDHEESIEPVRCDKRRWAYRMGAAGGDIPETITVTPGGTLDGKPVAARPLELLFDPKSFNYIVPDELVTDREEAYPG